MPDPENPVSVRTFLLEVEAAGSPKPPKPPAPDAVPGPFCFFLFLLILADRNDDETRHDDTRVDKDEEVVVVVVVEEGVDGGTKDDTTDCSDREASSTNNKENRLNVVIVIVMMLVCWLWRLWLGLWLPERKMMAVTYSDITVVLPSFDRTVKSKKGFVGGKKRARVLHLAPNRKGKKTPTTCTEESVEQCTVYQSPRDFLPALETRTRWHAIACGEASDPNKAASTFIVLSQVLPPSNKRRQTTNNKRTTTHSRRSPSIVDRITPSVVDRLHIVHHEQPHHHHDQSLSVQTQDHLCGYCRRY